jgi:hypothetical protein
VARAAKAKVELEPAAPSVPQSAHADEHHTAQRLPRRFSAELCETGSRRLPTLGKQRQNHLRRVGDPAFNKRLLSDWRFVDRVTSRGVGEA